MKREGFGDKKRGQSVHRVRLPHRYSDKAIRERKQQRRRGRSMREWFRLARPADRREVTPGSRSSCFCYLPLFHVTIIIRILSFSLTHSYSSLSLASLCSFVSFLASIPGHESSHGESAGGRLLAYASQVHQGGSLVNHLRSRTRCEGCGIPCPLPLLPLCPRPVSSKSRDWATAKNLVRWESPSKAKIQTMSKQTSFGFLHSRGSSCFQAVITASLQDFLRI